MRILIFYYCLLNAYTSLAQYPDDTRRDAQWLVGYKDSTIKTVINLFDFSQGALQIAPFPIHLGALPRDAPAHICDKNGELLLYATGCDVVDKHGNIIQNGAQITPDPWVYDAVCPDYYPYRTSLLMLTDPGDDSLFYLLALGHRPSTGSGTYAWGVYASHLSEQVVLQRNDLFCADSVYTGHLAACRHANGRDWWLVLNKAKTNRYYKYLIDPSGIHFVDLQSIGLPSSWEGRGTGQSLFSPDGRRFVRYENVADMFIFDFDRCSGQLSNFIKVNIDHNEDSGNSAGGLAISPNSRFAYTFNYLHAYQTDLNAPDLQASVTLVAYWDSTFVGPFKTTFGKAALAPDGKIYAAVPGSNPYMHTVHNPNFKGDSCQFAQHDLFLPFSWNVNTMVQIPNYRLGPLHGSSCDTLTTGVFTSANIDDSMHLLISPNPNSGQFHVSCTEADSLTWRMGILDMNGRQCWTGPFQSTFSTPHLVPGIYTLILTNSDNGMRKTARFVVQ